MYKRRLYPTDAQKRALTLLLLATAARTSAREVLTLRKYQLDVRVPERSPGKIGFGPKSLVLARIFAGLLVITVLLDAASVQGQEDTAFVSNLNQMLDARPEIGREDDSDSGTKSRNRRAAQVFSTGNAASGYRLSSVVLNLIDYEEIDGEHLEATLHFFGNTEDPIGTKILDFANPTTYSTTFGGGGPRTFAPADGTSEQSKTLLPNTDYVISFRLRVNGTIRYFEIEHTESDFETQESNWSIANGSYWKRAGWRWVTRSDSMMMKVSGTLAQPIASENEPPTGQPTIGGRARVGEALTTSVFGIADEDGLTGATYAYQWVANDGSTDTDIAGATDVSYTLTSAEAGKTVKVRVTFTDDGGTEETLTSAATATVVAPLTAEFLGLPENGHDGSTAFTFELKFREEIDISYETLRDSAFEVNGGSVTKARRLEQGKNWRWEIKIEPDTQGDLIIALPVGPACGEPNAICTTGGKQLSRRVEATVPGPASGNSPATGQPTIGGRARVGEALTTSVSGIADEDGLTGATYAYQWVANDGSTDTDIAGATDVSYTLTSAEAGKTVKVRVTFTDDVGTEETLTSAATVTVVAPLTAEFLGLPENGHDGSTAFTFELKFREEIDISYVTLRDSAFEVNGGSVTKTRRLEQGTNRRWEIKIEPDTQGDLIIALPVGPACGEPNAICTTGGKQLSRRVEATVPGPASTTAPEETVPTTVLRTLWSSTLTVGQRDFFGFIGSR